jgi:uncharacterized protein (TIGR02001 family)
MRFAFAALAAASIATGAAAQTTVEKAPASQPAAEPAPGASFHQLGGVALSYNLSVANDYAFRGVSQTDGEAQIAGGVDAAYKGFYAGVWTSRVDFKAFGDRDTRQEIDVYGGVKHSFGTTVLDVGVLYYGYAGQPTGGPSVDFVELYAKASRSFGPLTLGGSVNWSPDFTGEVGKATYLEANAAYALTPKLTVSGAVGRQVFDAVPGDYATWNIGAAYALTDRLSLDVRYWDTDEHRFGGSYGSRGVVGLKLAF